MRGLRNGKVADNGHDQLAQFEATLSEHHARANDRMDAVNSRIQSLEAELHALLQLRQRIAAASK